MKQSSHLEKHKSERVETKDLNNAKKSTIGKVKGNILELEKYITELLEGRKRK